MRYYLTERIQGSIVVVAEVIGRIDPDDGAAIPHYLGETDGLTREHLLARPGGRQALWAWERTDDSAYAEGREALMREADDDIALRPLRLVPR